MDIHIITKKTTNIPDKNGISKRKYVFTIKYTTIHNEYDKMEIYYVVRTIKDGSLNLLGSTIIDNFVDEINIDLNKINNGSIKKIITDIFIEYAKNNFLYGFTEFEEFTEIKTN